MKRQITLEDAVKKLRRSKATYVVLNGKVVETKEAIRQVESLLNDQKKGEEMLGKLCQAEKLDSLTFMF